MKVGILVDEIAPGSAPKLIGWPIRKLKEIGVEAEALIIVEKDHWKEHKTHYDYHLSGVKVRYIFEKFPKWIKKINFKFPGMSFFSLHHLASYLYAHRSVEPGEFDIILAYCQYSTFAARNIKKHCKVPFLFGIWDPSVFMAKKIYKNRFGWKYPVLFCAANLLDKFALKECEAVVTSGKCYHEYLKKRTNKPLEILVPGCFVKDELPPFSERKPMIVSYDRWDIGNIPNIFLDILEKLNRKDITLTIGGFWHPESLYDDFKNEVKKRDLEKRVELLGPLDDKMITDLCSKAMVHVHPVHEAFGMQTLEAAACGCPGIIPKGSGVADLFEHGISGFHPASGDIEAMAGYINDIFNDPKRAEKMSLAAWEVAKQYTWANHVLTIKKMTERYVYPVRDNHQLKSVVISNGVN